ncbi:MAG: ATP-binding cassette domain-containing protein [Acetobacteraceae bacterium]|nr:ATP-binding cassette domain-containing protein [Acetobacteraceae bacterium]
MSDPSPLLVVEDLKVHFPIKAGTLVQRQVASVKAVDGVSFLLNRGETLGLVGESGCGKSTTGLAVLRMLDITAGRVVFDGEDITRHDRAAMRPIRKRMQMVYQDPYGSLNPRMKVVDLIAEPMIVHDLLPNRAARADRARELLALVGLRPDMADRYIHEFSGGQRQRIGVARALSMEPDLLICDEPVSALDVSIQAQIVNLFQDLQQSLGLTYIFVAHDLAVVRHISDRIAVMYLGRIAEIADRETLYRRPLHPYTQALLAAVPIPDPEIEATRPQIAVAGEVPSALNPPPGCRFHTRCPLAVARCRTEEPALRDVGAGQMVSCHLV